MKYIATVNTPGYLSHDPETLFDTAGAAWGSLAEDRERDEEMYMPDEPEYSATVDDLHSMMIEDTPGTIYGSTPGYTGEHDLGLAYVVTAVDETEYDAHCGYGCSNPYCQV